MNLGQILEINDQQFALYPQSLSILISNFYLVIPLQFGLSLFDLFIIQYLSYANHLHFCLHRRHC